MKRAALQKHIANNGGDLFINTVDNALWATNRYWLTPVAEDGPFAELLTWWNLPLATGTYNVNGRVSLALNIDPPDIAKLLAKPSKNLLALERVEIPAKPAVRCVVGGGECTLLRGADGVLVVLRTEYLDVVAPKWEDPATTFKQTSHLQPVAVRTSDGPMSLVMPVRT